MKLKMNEEATNKDRIIFLGIDGVINSEDWFRNDRAKGNVDPKAIQLLNTLEGASVVVSSSWGYDNGRTEKTLKEVGLTLPIVR